MFAVWFLYRMYVGLYLIAEEIRQVRAYKGAAGRTMHAGCRCTAAAAHMRKNRAAGLQPFNRGVRFFGKNLDELGIACLLAALHRVGEHHLGRVLDALSLLEFGACSIHAAGCKLAVAARNSHFFEHHNVLDAGFLSSHCRNEARRTGTDDEKIGFFSVSRHGVGIFLEIFDLRRIHGCLVEVLLHCRKIVAVRAVGNTGFVT